jgi:acyl carrier protein
MNMEPAEIIKQLDEIFVDVIDNEDIKLTTETTAGDVDGWDSLSHIQLVVAIEKHFRIRFTAKEIQSWKNVGELVASIQSKIK